MYENHANCTNQSAKKIHNDSLNHSLFSGWFYFVSGTHNTILFKIKMHWLVKSALYIHRINK